MRHLTHVPAVLELRKMLPADMNMRSIDPALHLRPEAFDGLRVNAVAGSILPRAMIDRQVRYPARHSS